MGWFKHLSKFLPNTFIKSDPMNDKLDRIAASFDYLPTPRESGEKGFIDPLAVGGATKPEHATTAGQSVNRAFNTGLDTGTANNYDITIPITITSYTDGLEIWFKPVNNCTGASQVKVNGLGYVPLKKANGQNLSPGDLSTESYASFRFNGTEFRSTGLLAGDAYSGMAYMPSDVAAQGGIGADEASSSVDWNSLDVAKAGCSRYLLHGSNPNGPPENIWFFAFTFEYGSKNGDGDLTMLAVSRDSQAMYIRRRLSGSWSEWAKFAIMSPQSGNEGEQLNFESSPSSGLSHLALDVYGTSSSNNHFRMLQRASDDTSRVLDFPIVNGTVWTNGNDGAGSGLDADKLDGLQGSDYLPKSGGTITGTLNVNGTYKISGYNAISFSNPYIDFGDTLTRSRLQGAVIYLQSTIGSIWYDGDVFTPQDDNICSLGLSSARWTKIFAVNGTIDTSDERLKDIKDIGDTSWVYDLKPIAYTWKDKPCGTRYGFGAQTTYKLMPDKTANLVNKPDNQDDTWGMQPDQLIPVLLNEMKILRQRIEQLEAK